MDIWNAYFVHKLDCVLSFKGMLLLILIESCVKIDLSSFAFLYKDIFFVTSFTLYPARSRVGRGNLVLRHSLPTFCRILEALRVEWRNSTMLFDLTREWRNRNINLNKYSMLRMGIEPTTSRVYRLEWMWKMFTITLCVTCLKY